MSKSKRDSILNKIRLLREMTVKNGCTEAEAMTAGAKIAALMEEYDLTWTDVELGASECKFQKIRVDHKHPLRICAVGVAYLTDTESWVEIVQAPVYEDHPTRGRRQTGWKEVDEVNFFGLPSDVEIALYMMSICRTAMLTESRRYEKEQGLAFVGHRLKDLTIRDFRLGMAHRMVERLKQMKDARKVKRPGLVRAKYKMIIRDLEKHGIKLRKGSGLPGAGANAFADGVEAGGRVAFNPGVRGSNEGPKLIG